MNKKLYETRKANIEAKLTELDAKVDAAQNLTPDEMKSIMERSKELRAELKEVNSYLDIIAEEEARSAAVVSPFTPLNAMNTQRNETNNGTLEFRFWQALMNKGPIPQELIYKRAAGDPGATQTGEVQMLIPQTYMKRIIDEANKGIYQLYSKVQKTSYPGAVAIPIMNLKASVKWIGESESSNSEKLGDANKSITFLYHTGEIKVATSFLASVTTVDAFGDAIVAAIAEAYVADLERCILSGNGVNEPLGIINDPRITNKPVLMNPTQMSDWKSWRKNLLQLIPMSMKGKGEFIFTSGTVEGYLNTMADNNNRPIYNIAANGTIGDYDGKFFGRPLTMVEPGLGIKDYDDAEDGDVIGIFWQPDEYYINSNFNFTMSRYYNHDKNEDVTHCLFVIDGKIADPRGFYLIKKSSK